MHGVVLPQPHSLIDSLYMIYTIIIINEMIKCISKRPCITNFRERIKLKQSDSQRLRLSKQHTTRVKKEMPAFRPHLGSVGTVPALRPWSRWLLAGDLFNGHRAGVQGAQCLHAARRGIERGRGPAPEYKPWVDLTRRGTNLMVGRQS